MRALAHRGEPVDQADGVDAQAISGLIHWGLIQRFGSQRRAHLIVLHRAPYGSLPASSVPGSLSEEAWIEASSKLRLEHELTHLTTKRLLGKMHLNCVLLADFMLVGNGNKSCIDDLATAGVQALRTQVSLEHLEELLDDLPPYAAFL